MQTLAEQASAFAEIQGYLVTAAGELFEAYGMPVQHSFGGAADTRGQSVMAVIGYAAESVRGAVLLLTSRPVVDALQPEELRATGLPDDVVLCDVLGEFANMLLGRVKNQLATRALSPLMATPTTFVGDDLGLPAPKSGLSAWHRFACPTGDIFVRLDATFEADFTLAPRVKTTEPPLREGDMILFSEVSDER
jgi:CheY-specific phosphatase CheX